MSMVYVHISYVHVYSVYVIDQFEVALFDGDNKLNVYRHQDLGSPPLFVIFLVWKVFVISFDPKHLQVKYIHCTLCTIGFKLFHHWLKLYDLITKALCTPRHDKPKFAVKWFQTLFGER